MRNISLFALTAALAIWPVSVPCAGPVPGSQPETVLHVRAELVGMASTIEPGRPFGAGLHLIIDRGWHVNWRNPGDAGLAPTLTWQLPPGFAAGPIEWPAPERMVEGPLASYGYQDEIFLPVTITPPDELPTDSTVSFKVLANWLECSDVCIPGKAELQLTLGVATAEPSIDPRYRRLYDSIRDRLPRAAPPGSFTARLEAREIVVEGTAAVSNAPDSVLFFPFERGLIDHAAAVQWSVNEGRLAVRLARPANHAGDPAQVEGILYVVPDTMGSSAARVLAISAPVTGGTGLPGSLRLAIIVLVIAAGASWLALRRSRTSI